MKQKPQSSIAVPPEIAERYANADQYKHFDAAVIKVLSLSPARAESIRRMVKEEIALHPRKRGRKPKAPSAVHVPAV
jgi:hypothetical protein